MSSNTWQQRIPTEIRESVYSLVPRDTLRAGLSLVDKMTLTESRQIFFRELELDWEGINCYLLLRRLSEQEEKMDLHWMSMPLQSIRVLRLWVGMVSPADIALLATFFVTSQAKPSVLVVNGCLERDEHWPTAYLEPLQSALADVHTLDLVQTVGSSQDSMFWVTICSGLHTLREVVDEQENREFLARLRRKRHVITPPSLVIPYGPDRQTGWGVGWDNPFANSGPSLQGYTLKACKLCTGPNDQLQLLKQIEAWIGRGIALCLTHIDIHLLQWVRSDGNKELRTVLVACAPTLEELRIAQLVLPNEWDMPDDEIGKAIVFRIEPWNRFACLRRLKVPFHSLACWESLLECTREQDMEITCLGSLERAVTVMEPVQVREVIEAFRRLQRAHLIFPVCTAAEKAYVQGFVELYN